MTQSQNKRQIYEKYFRETDTDHKGSIDYNQIPALLRKCCAEKNKECSEEDIQKMAAKFQKDQSGRVSQEKFLSTMEELRKECSDKEKGGKYEGKEQHNKDNQNKTGSDNKKY